MNRSNPSTVAGGGEMNRVTSSPAIARNNEGASLTRSSRKVTCVPARAGSPLRQSFFASGDGTTSAVVDTTVSSLAPS